MRNDVEYTFGILKGLFCILRYGLRFTKVQLCNQTWLTSYALHDMLLYVDATQTLEEWRSIGLRDNEYEMLH